MITDDVVKSDSSVWFKRLGTFAFDYLLMKDLIFFGEAIVDTVTNEIIRDTRNKSTLCLTLWMMMVPEVFRDQAMKKAMSILKKEFAYDIANEELIVRFISRFHREMDHDIERRYLTREGWRSE